jgi:hydroxymethyl cephem carbamoyltransferase
VFIPPCADDSGSAIGTAIDGLNATGGGTSIEWDVYSGQEFVMDQPDRVGWYSKPLEASEIAGRILDGDVVPWVEGKAEIGPRALGHRSLLAEPARPEMQARLNAIKQRESFRPIAPCCRLEDVAKISSDTFHDPFMLYFRTLTGPRLGAVTHVDGTARVQTVTSGANPRLHDLLGAVARRIGVGAVCNTSLNFKGHGFINRLSDLLLYCEMHGLPACVVNGAVYERADEKGRASRSPAAMLVSEA